MLSRMAVGLCCRTGPALSTVVRSGVKPLAGITRSSVQQQYFRGFREARGRTTRKIIYVKTAETAAGKFKSPTFPLDVGQAAVAGASVLGLGALCFYGLGLSNETGAIDHAVAWPEHVRTRVRDTYLYLGASVAATAGSAIAIYRSPLGQRLFAYSQRHPIISTVGILAAMIGTGTAMQSVPYTPGIGTKQGLWLINCATLGLVVAPIGALGGALAMRAAWYTAGVVGGLSCVAACAPSGKFLTWGGPLGIGLGTVFVASIGSMAFPVTSTLGMSLYSISLYGGLILFSAFLLYDTHKVINRAETHHEGQRVWNGQEYAPVLPFDPINASHRLVMDVLNIFIRIAQMLAMGGGRKK